MKKVVLKNFLILFLININLVLLSSTQPAENSQKLLEKNLEKITKKIPTPLDFDIARWENKTEWKPIVKNPFLVSVLLSTALTGIFFIRPQVREEIQDDEQREQERQEKITTYPQKIEQLTNLRNTVQAIKTLGHAPTEQERLALIPTFNAQFRNFIFNPNNQDILIELYSSESIENIQDVNNNTEGFKNSQRLAEKNFKVTKQILKKINGEITSYNNALNSAINTPPFSRTSALRNSIISNFISSTPTNLLLFIITYIGLYASGKEVIKE